MPIQDGDVKLLPKEEMWKYALTVGGEPVMRDFPAPHPMQLYVMQECQSGKYANIFVVGNRGGGKSVMARALCHGLAMAYPGFKYIILRTAFPDLNRNHLIFLKDEMLKLGGDYNKTDHIATYPNGSFGFYMQCSTDDDVNKAVGAEAALVVFDEAPMFEWEHMTMIGASLRIKVDAHYHTLALYLGNPTGQSIDNLYAYCVDKDVEYDDDPEYSPSDWHHIRLQLSDNPSIDADKYLRRFSGLPAHIRRAWVEGERTLERTLFVVQKTILAQEVDPETGQMVEVEKPYHVIDELPTYQGESILDQPWVRIEGSYDHGYIDPAVRLWFAVVGRRVICFKESVWQMVHADEIARETLQESAGLRVRRVFCDPKIDVQDGSVESIKESMERQKIWTCSIHGTRMDSCCETAKRLSLRMDCAVNDRELFSDVIHRALSEKSDPWTPRLQLLSGDITRRIQLKNGHTILANGCPYLIKSIPKMRWSKNNPKKLDDHKHDHPVVALAYYFMNLIGETQPGREVPEMNEYLKEALHGSSRDSQFVLGSESVRSRY